MSQAFANLDGLVRLSQKEGVDISRPLLRVLTDLYVQEKSHTRDEEQQYAELALRLLPTVDASTRAAVARKLGSYPLAPAAVLEVLRTDAAEIATLVPERPVPPTARESAATAPIASEIANPIEDKPRPSPIMATRLTGGMPNLGDAFLRAERAERVTFIEALRDDDAIEATPLGLPARPGAGHRLERAAMQRNTTEFARELQLSLGITGRTATRIVQDDSGEPLLTAVKALDVDDGGFVRILLFLNPTIGESVTRTFALARLYETLPASAVAPIVASWREESSARPATRYQPLHAVEPASAATWDHARTAREAATPDRRSETGTQQRGQSKS